MVWDTMHQQPTQQSQGQAVTGTGPIVTDVGDDDRLDFQGGQNPQTGPPNGGTRQVTTKPPRSRKHEVTLKKF